MTDAQQHLAELKKELLTIDAIKAPEWAQFVKTGMHKERPPEDPQWWHMRTAAILRTVGTRGPVGVAKLRKKYGGRHRRGYKPARFAHGSGNIIRKCLQQLEAAELVKQVDIQGHKGRALTPKGQSLLAQAAKKAAHASKQE